MCLIAFAINVSQEYPLVLIANRDEFFDRPTEPLSWWDNGILAGRDLEAGGTWLGITKTGRFAALTNYRDLKKEQRRNARSRGDLTTNYLSSTFNPLKYLEAIQSKEDDYRGYNLIVGDRGSCFHYSNISKDIFEVKDGTHAVSNALFDTSWPKTKLARDELEKIVLNKQSTIELESLVAILMNSDKADEPELPSTGLSIEAERVLSSIFVNQEVFNDRIYGTRSSAVILVSNTGEVLFKEMLHDVAGQKSFRFNLQD